MPLLKSFAYTLIFDFSWEVLAHFGQLTIVIATYLVLHSLSPTLFYKYTHGHILVIPKLLVHLCNIREHLFLTCSHPSPVLQHAMKASSWEYPFTFYTWMRIISLRSEAEQFFSVVFRPSSITVLYLNRIFAYETLKRNWEGYIEFAHS